VVIALSEVSALFEEHERNSRWFEENYERLVEKYDGMFIAIYKQEIVAFDEDPGKLREKILAKGLSPMTVMIEYASKKPLEFIMIIRGFIDRSFSPPAPAVKAFISIEKLKVKGYIKFLLDTGASATAILDRDRELLGLRIDELEKAPTRIGGVGGLVDTYIARDAEIISKT